MLKELAIVAVDIGIGVCLARFIDARKERRPIDKLAIANLVVFVALAILLRT